MACQQRRNSQAAAEGAGLDDADLRFSRYQYRCATSRGEGRNGEASSACRRQTAEVSSSSNGLSSVAGGLAQNECAAEKAYLGRAPSRIRRESALPPCVDGSELARTFF